jgi:hypothetical protein
MTNLTSSCRASRPRFSQSFLSASPLAGTLDVDDFEDRRRHPRNGPMTAGLEHDALAGGQQAVHQG